MTFWSISAILQAIHKRYVSKLSAIHADQYNQIEIKSCDYHVTKMAAEERAFKKTVRLIIPAPLLPPCLKGACNSEFISIIQSF